MIYDGPSTQLTAIQRKRECREVFAARMAVPQYLNWSNTPSPSIETTILTR
jgi:hypothetical protein